MVSRRFVAVEPGVTETPSRPPGFDGPDQPVHDQLLSGTCSEIGELVLQQLAGISDVAYVRFASVYRQFQSVSDFVATLEGLSREPLAKRLAAAI